MAIQDYTKLNLVETAAPKFGPTPLMQALDMWIANRKEKRERAMEDRKMGLEERRVKATEESTRAQVEESRARSDEAKRKRADDEALKKAAGVFRSKLEAVGFRQMSPQDRRMAWLNAAEEIDAELNLGGKFSKQALDELDSRTKVERSGNTERAIKYGQNGEVIAETRNPDTGELNAMTVRNPDPIMTNVSEGGMVRVTPRQGIALSAGPGMPAGAPTELHPGGAPTPYGPAAGETPGYTGNPALAGMGQQQGDGSYTIMGPPRREPRGGGGGVTQDDKMTTLATNMAYKDLQKAQDALDALPFKYDQRKKQINAMYPKPVAPRILTASAAKEYSDAKAKYETDRARAMADLEQERVTTERSLIARRDQAAQALKLAGTGNGAAAFDALSTRSPALATAPGMGDDMGQGSAFDNTAPDNPAVNSSTVALSPGVVGRTVNPVQMGPEAQATLDAPWFPTWFTGARNTDAAQEILMRNKYRPAALSPGLVP
jgi:hypothetical protein